MLGLPGELLVPTNACFPCFPRPALISSRSANAVPHQDRITRMKTATPRHPSSQGNSRSCRHGTDKTPKCTSNAGAISQVNLTIIPYTLPPGTPFKLRHAEPVDNCLVEVIPLASGAGDVLGPCCLVTEGGLLPLDGHLHNPSLERVVRQLRRSSRVAAVVLAA